MRELYLKLLRLNEEDQKKLIETLSDEQIKQLEAYIESLNIK